MKLSTRLAIAMVGLVLVTLTAVGAFAYRTLEATLLASEADRIQTHVRQLASEIESYVRGTRGDVLSFRAAVALQGIVRASLNGGFDPRDGTPLLQWRDGLAARLAAELAAKPTYAQFRVIGTGDGGREILRVDRSGPGNAVRVVPAGELGQRGDRAYFKSALNLAEGEVYVSPIELQQTGPADALRLPVLRVATPVKAPDGSTWGMIVVNVNLQPVFNRVSAATGNDLGERSIYIANASGDYLVNPDHSREFAFESGKTARWQDDFPEFAQAVQGTMSGARVANDAAGRRLGMAIATIQLADGPSVSVLETLPYSELMAPAFAIGRATAIAGGVAIALAILLSVLLARSLTRPLAQMTRAVEDFAEGKSTPVPTNAVGETGVLARAFEHMMSDVREKNAALTHEIEERRRLFETSLDLILVTDRQGNFLRVSPSSLATVGYTPEEMAGRSARDFVHTDDLENTRSEMRAARRGKQMRNFETRYLHKDGHPVMMSWSGVWSEPAQSHFFIGRDISERVRLEQQLRQSQKMDAIGQLTGGIAHDFNNILTVITGTIESLADSAGNDPRAKELAGLIDEAAQRGADLTRHLLAFARRQPLQPSHVDLNKLVGDVEKLLRPTLGEQIDIELVLEADLWPGLVDPNQLTTALLNLAINARDAMPNGGKLTLETKNVTLDETYAEMHSEVTAGPYAMIAVSDTGSGIPAAMVDKVFEPFFTTKGIGKGTGLGLSMVYGFVKQSNGHVKIYSEEGHGTTMKVYLPRAGEGVEAVTPAATASPAAGGNETILVVEDDTLVRKNVVARLESLGYRPLAVPNATEALARLEGGERVDLLFTDVVMPGPINGRQLANEVTKRWPKIAILFTSGYTENAIVHHGRLDPGVLLLTKPYRRAELARMVRIALDARVTAAA